MDSTIRIKKFDPGQMKPDRILLLVGNVINNLITSRNLRRFDTTCQYSAGKRGTGKSVLLEDLMRFMIHSIDFPVAMVPTEESTAMFRKHIHDAWIYPRFNEAKVEAMIAMQRGLLKKGKERHILLVLDDCMYDKK